MVNVPMERKPLHWVGCTVQRQMQMTNHVNPKSTLHTYHADIIQRRRMNERDMETMGNVERVSE